MSLLTICQFAANAAGLAFPTQIIGNTDTNSRRLLAQAQEAVRALMDVNEGAWNSLDVPYTFQIATITITGTVTAGSAQITGITPNTTGIIAGIFGTLGNGFPNNTMVQTVVDANTLTMTANAKSSGTQSIVLSQCGYPLPPDFLGFIDSTMWDRSRYWALRGPLSPQQWQVYKSSLIGKATIQRRWRVIAVNGIPYFFIDPNPSDAGSVMVFEYRSRYPIISAAVPPVAQAEWQADTDRCAIIRNPDGTCDEYLMNLSVKWRILDSLGMDFSSALDAYNRAVDIAVAENGGAGILDIAPVNSFMYLGPWNVPESGFGPTGG